MRRHSQRMSNVPTFQAKQHNGVAKARNSHGARQSSKRARGMQRNECLPFTPPEDWHEPTGEHTDYRIIVQDPGPGYRHILTPQEVRDRLAMLPDSFVRPLETVQFSCMTAKKRSFPCYGMQWGTAYATVRDIFIAGRPRFIRSGLARRARIIRAASACESIGVNPFPHAVPRLMP